MNIYIEENIKDLGEWFGASGSRLLLVGGIVRNRLLGLTVTDIDVCSDVLPDRVVKLGGGRFSISERSYGLGTFVIVQEFRGSRYTYEYTAMRTDSYGRGGEHRPQQVVFTSDITQDAGRRDFTVNALYADTQNGGVLDPLSRGLTDIDTRTLVMTHAGAMEEDALRILRMARFSAQLGFSIDEDTFRAAAKNAPNLANISGERIREELFSIVMADRPYGRSDAVINGLHTLKHTGALTTVIPEFAAGDGFVQSKAYHKYDVLEHSLMTCAAACADIRVRLAALLHDIAKPSVYAGDGNMYRHPFAGADTAREILGRLRADKRLIDDVCSLIREHMFDLDNSAGEKAVIRMIVKMGSDQFIRLCCLREADFTGSGMGAVADSAAKWRAVLAKLEASGAPINRSDLAVNGSDIQKELGVPPGKLIGTILTELQKFALKKPSQNNYKSLVRYAKMIYGNLENKDAP